MQAGAFTRADVMLETNLMHFGKQLAMQACAAQAGKTAGAIATAAAR
jgi:hypothetical protein